jgi:HEPN domain-containing protein
MTAKLIVSYFQLAEEGLKTANILLQADQFRDATYFAQQVTERIARALLTHAGRAFGTAHNLGQMAETLPEDHPFKSRIKALDELSTAATKFRYPSPTGRLAIPPSAEALRKTLDEIEVLLRDAKAHASGPQPKP